MVSLTSWGLPTTGLGNIVMNKAQKTAPTQAQEVPQEKPWWENLLQNSWSAEAVESDRKWAEAQAQKQMDFQKMMSDTAYQRAVKDLKEAGLNPALAYMQGSASTSAGALAQSSSTRQQADLKREENIFRLTESLVGALGGIINSVIGLAKPLVVPTTPAKPRVGF